MRVVTMALLEVLFWLVSGIAVLTAYLTSWHIAFAYIHALLIFQLLYFSVVRVPLILNWSDNLYGSALARVFFLHIFAIFTYALCYFRDESLSSSLESFQNALYFSATTWTTLGYGDISPSDELQLLTSIQALSGLVSFAVLAAVVWLYCERRLWEPGKNKQVEDHYEVELDAPFGLFRPTQSETTIKEQEKRNKLHLDPCSICGGSARIEKYYDIIGRTTPLPKFVTNCIECGNLIKPQYNAYLAAWKWNRTVKRSSAKH